MSGSMRDLIPPRSGQDRLLELSNNLRRNKERQLLDRLARFDIRRLGVSNEATEELRDLQSQARRHFMETL